MVDSLVARENVRNFEVPFACFDITVAWDEHQNLWLATDNGLAVASWLTAYDQWPPNWPAIIQVCGVCCCQEVFYAFGNQADEVARRLTIALLYLNQVRQYPQHRYWTCQFDYCNSVESNHEVGESYGTKS